MSRIKSRNNVAIEQAVLAIARAHTRVPAFDLVRAKELAAKIDGVLVAERTAECVVALCIALLRGLGVSRSDLAARF